MPTDPAIVRVDMEGGRYDITIRRGLLSDVAAGKGGRKRGQAGKGDIPNYRPP